MVNIGGLDKADVLAVLYNAASPHGMGFLQTAHAPVIMRRDDARKVIENRGDDTTERLRQLDLTVTRLGMHQLRFGYVYGRPIKTDLSGDQMADQFYDHYHGAGHAAAAIAELRRTGQALTDTIFAMHSRCLQKEAVEILESPEAVTSFEKEAGMGDFTERLVSLVRRSLGSDSSN